MRSNVNDSVGSKDLLEVGIKSHESVMRSPAFGGKHAHRVALVSESRLDSYEDVAKPEALNEDVLTIRIQLAGSRSPLLLDLTHVWAQPIVVSNAHPVPDGGWAERSGRHLFSDDRPLTLDHSPLSTDHPPLL